MRSLTKTMLIEADPQTVFAYMDAISNTGGHMMKDSSMMMGSRLQLDQLSPNATGQGARYRWYGNVMGFPMDFTIVVTKWIENTEKVWETTGQPKMLILSWYQMRLLIKPVGNEHKSQVTLSFHYKRPKQMFWQVMSVLLADGYANWCVKSMLQDSKAALESNRSATTST